MSRYDLDNMIKFASSMDDSSKLPSKQPRWQRKNDSELYNSFNVSAALNQTNDLLTNLTVAETLRRNQNNDNNGCGPSHNYSQHKTPAKTPRSNKSSQNSNRKHGHTPAGKTPSRHNGVLKPTVKTPRTPMHGGMDRFIPNRNGMDLEKSHYLMTQANKTGQENADPQLRDKLSSNLDQYRIMCYADKAPVAPEGQANELRVVYSSTKANASGKKATRVIPSIPEKVLDAPEVVNDWYINILSWSSSNVLAVALKSTVYLWNAVTGDIKCLLETPPNEYVSSISWIQDGNQLAVGSSLNTVEIWDADTSQRLRKMAGHSQRVDALDWNLYTLSSGSKSGLIFHHDVRKPDHHVGTLNGHSGHEVCGLKWSPDGKYLASGSNDNKVNIWNGSDVTLNADSVSPMQELGHSSAIKAIAWCPWRPHMVATGGGTTDRHIRIWNSSNGNCLYSVDTKSQISGLDWNEEYQEIISAHGYQNNEINIWKFPTMSKVAELRGHVHRILGMCLCPDKSTVVSLSADETLRFWHCFPVDIQKKKKLELSAKKTLINPIRMSLR